VDEHPDAAHEYRDDCYCERCDTRRRAQAVRDAMLHDDEWLFAWGAWQASPWNVGGSKALEELQVLGTTAYIGKAYHSKPPLPVRYADIAAAVADLDERSQACIELYYVLGVGLPTPRTYPDKYPEEIEAMIRHQAWTADDGWGDTALARVFARMLDEGLVADEPDKPPWKAGWKASADTWGRRRAAAIAAIVRRVTGG
jgi:hypothetical protein